MFVSQKRIEANRRNAQKSTGPRTEEGKARVSQNGLKHGLYATKPILTVAGWAEQPADYDSLCSALTAELRPASPVEHLLVRRLTAYAWHLTRAEKIAEALEANPFSVGTLRQAQGEVVAGGTLRQAQGDLVVAQGLRRSIPSSGLTFATGKDVTREDASDLRNQGDVVADGDGRHARKATAHSSLRVPNSYEAEAISPRPPLHLLTVLIRRLRARMERTFDTFQSVRDNRHADLVAQISAALQKTNYAGNKATSGEGCMKGQLRDVSSVVETLDIVRGVRSRAPRNIVAGAQECTPATRRRGEIASSRTPRNDGVFDVSSVVETQRFRSRSTTSPLDYARGVAQTVAIKPNAAKPYTLGFPLSRE